MEWPLPAVTHAPTNSVIPPLPVSLRAAVSKELIYLLFGKLINSKSAQLSARGAFEKPVAISRGHWSKISVPIVPLSLGFQPIGHRFRRLATAWASLSFTGSGRPSAPLSVQLTPDSATSPPHTRSASRPMQGNTLPFLDTSYGLALSYMSTLTPA